MRFIVAHLLFNIGEDKSVISAMVPSIHDWRGKLDYSWQGAHPVKTHLTSGNIPKRMHTHSAIYIIRNPLDVVDSALSYFKPDKKERADLIHQFCVTGSTEPWFSTLGYSSWNNNVDSWTNKEHNFPVKAIRYEDLLENPEENIQSIADFLGVDASQKKIKEIVRETSFDKMKKTEDMELKSGQVGVFFDEHKYSKTEFTFMRSGKSGGYRENLTESEISRLMDYFGPHMEKYGYS
jgi:hypothetical protein